MLLAQDRLVVGSKNFTENRLLSEIMAQLIESRTDLQVERRVNLGGTMVVGSALREGEIDLYPEYTGTAWAIHLGITAKVEDPLRAYYHVAREYRQRYGITWLAPFGFSNSFALAVSEDFAERFGLTRISDLLAHADSIRAGVSHEFLNREDGYPGLARAYGFEIKQLRGMEHGLAYTAIDSGRIDLIDTWTTDAKLRKYRIRILEDDKHFFPPYDCVPIIRTEVLERHPSLEGVLNDLGFGITNELMQKLNYQVEVEERPFDEVAREFLQSTDWTRSWIERRMDAGPRVGMEGGSRRGQNFFDFMADRAAITLSLTVEHLVLTLGAVVMAVVVAVPLGILLTRRRTLAGPVLTATGVLQTIPSLALLAFFIPVFGLGVPAALAALFLYALLPIVRNTYTGINEIDRELIDAARGMGLTRSQILRLVELPLATRTIMAGVRTATVISIGVATLAAFIGAGGLGDPIVTGLQLDNTHEVLSGAIPAALLAIVIDFSLGRAENAMTRRKTA
jgi:osmoprotectant transport system permease protein